MQKRMKRILFFLLLLIMLTMVGCHQEPVDATTGPTQLTTAPTQAQDYKDIYRSAAADISQRKELVLDIRFSQSRTVDGIPLYQSGTATAFYTGLGTAGMEALISEKLTFGTYEADYTQSYLKGRAYTQTNGSSFISHLSAEEFLSYQIPAVLIDSSLYGSVTWEGEPGTGITYQFSQPSGFEAWTRIPEDAQLLELTASATLDKQGILRESSYRVSYILDGIQCVTEVHTVISFPDAQTSPTQPNYPQDCVRLDAYLAPRLILQTVGNVYSIENISGTQTETVYCEAAAVVRTQQVAVDAAGSGTDFMAQVGYTVNLTNYAGTPTVNTQVETFRNGSYSYRVNGGDPVPQTSITAQQMRQYCEDTLLSSLLTPEQIAGAAVVETEDFYCIQFTCKDALSDTIFADVFKLLNLDLDNFSQSFTTETGTAYLTINKHTGMPATIGRSFTRIHLIDNVAYRTTYQSDSTLSLPSSTAYDTITGQQIPETKPETKATPLFYKVTDKKGRTLWLLGTIHVGDNRTGYLPQEIYDAFSASDSLAVEFDTVAFQQQAASDPVLQAQLSGAYYYSDGSATSDHLEPALYQKAYALILASGSNSIDAAKMKPAIWESLLQNFFLSYDGSLSPEKGMDLRLLTLARQQGKTILDIESGISQLQMLTGFSDALQSMLLAQTVNTSLADYCESVLQLYEAWCSGDEAALIEAITDDTSAMSAEELALYSEYQKAMVTNRNAVMLKAAKNYIKSGDTVFFAVGLAHLLGEDGLVTTLKDAGYTVEPVTYN